MAGSQAASAASAAAYLAMFEASPAGWPWSGCQPACRVISAVSPVQILGRASGGGTHWRAAVGADRGVGADPALVEVQGVLPLGQQQVDREQLLGEAGSVGGDDEQGE